jgi:hypothetical protein
MALENRVRNKNPLVDAICINQEDVVERVAQVSIMDEISRKAYRVRVWLGRGSNDTQEALTLAHAISELLDINGTLNQEQKEDVLKCSRSSWDALSGLFSASYWSRVWIIQEFVLARDVVVHYGKNRINWAYLEAILL